MYQYDSRDWASSERKAISDMIDIAKDNDLGRLPFIKEVCHECHGTGTYVNPSIDAGGLSYEDMHDWDDDMICDYRSGRYDVTCERCDGNNVVDVFDEDNATPEQIKFVDNFWKYYYEDKYTRIAEMRAGC